MSTDIAPILDGWEWEQNRLVVRKIEGLDGKEKIQMRLELGVFQMEAEGRPDGQRPYGHESLLDYHREMAEQSRTTGEDYKLDSEQCEALQSESLQHYHRRICCLALGEYDRAEADAQHNLRIMDLMKEHVAREEDWQALEQWRAFVLCQRTQSRALRSFQNREFEKALRHIEHGIDLIKDWFKEQDREESIEHSLEIATLKQLRESLAIQKPPSKEDRLRRRMERAIRSENYEFAAQLRDKLRDIEKERGRDS